MCIFTRPHSMRKAWENGQVSIHPSVCLSHRSTAAAAAGGFAAEVGRRQQIPIDSCCCRATRRPRKFWSDCRQVQHTRFCEARVSSPLEFLNYPRISGESVCSRLSSNGIAGRCRLTADDGGVNDSWLMAVTVSHDLCIQRSATEKFELKQ